VNEFAIRKSIQRIALEKRYQLGAIPAQAGEMAVRIGGIWIRRQSIEQRPYGPGIPFHIEDRRGHSRHEAYGRRGSIVEGLDRKRDYVVDETVRLGGYGFSARTAAERYTDRA